MCTCMWIFDPTQCPFTVLMACIYLFLLIIDRVALAKQGDNQQEQVYARHQYSKWALCRIKDPHTGTHTK